MPPTILNPLVPSPILQPFIHHYEWYEFDDSIPETSHEAYPNFATGFLFFFYRGKRILASNAKVDEVELLESSLLPPTTLLTYNRRICQLKAFRVIFQPGAISSIYDLDMASVRNELMSLPKVIGQELEPLYANMAASPGREYCIQQFEDYLFGKLIGPTEKPQLFLAAKAILKRFGHAICVRRLADELGRSKRHLNRLMNRELGFSAKEFLRIHRFCGALQHFHRSPQVSISQTAYEFGYCDQAHFSHEFKRMTGSTPRGYLQRIGRKELYVHGENHEYSGLVLVKK